MLTTVANHLWQSTAFAAVAAVLALSLRGYRAQLRHRIWLIASVKFLVPFSLLTGLGSLLPARRVEPRPRLTLLVEEISRPFVPLPAQDNRAPARQNPVETVLLAVWIGGSSIVLIGWYRRSLPIRRALRSAVPLPLESAIPVRASRDVLEPGVYGIFRPVLLLPEGIADRLSAAQFKAVLAHELCHVQRRDNLISAVHMAVETIFWFHPALWWIGSRLIEERESACDEEVLRSGSDPETYAESILRVCRFYLESPLPCVAGITGASLHRRIEQIMLHRVAPGLGFGRKLALAAIAAAMAGGPFLVGMSRAQAPAAGKLEFEVASVKPNKSGVSQIRIQRGQGYLGTNVTLRNLIQFAYQAGPDTLSGLPGWVEGEHFDVAAKAPENASDEQRRQMMQALLAERFKLAVHRETKEMPIYALVVAKGTPKLQPSKAQETEFQGGRGLFRCTAVPMQMLAGQLRRLLGRPVHDETGLKGEYDFNLEWTPDEPAPAGSPEAVRTAPPERAGPSIFTALQEQLGLKLESRKGSEEVLVVDRVERVPTEN